MASRFSVMLALILELSLLIFASAMRSSCCRGHRCVITSLCLDSATIKCCADTTRNGKSLSNSPRYRHILKASAKDNDDGAIFRVPLGPPTRCSSSDAASIITNSISHDGLLIITCDASGRGVSFALLLMMEKYL